MQKQIMSYYRWKSQTRKAGNCSWWRTPTNVLALAAVGWLCAAHRAGSSCACARWTTPRRRWRRSVWTSTFCGGRTAGGSGTRSPRASTTPSSTTPCSCPRTLRANSAWCSGNTAQVSCPILLPLSTLSLSANNIKRYVKKKKWSSRDITVSIYLSFRKPKETDRQKSMKCISVHTIFLCLWNVYLCVSMKCIPVCISPSRSCEFPPPPPPQSQTESKGY